MPQDDPFALLLEQHSRILHRVCRLYARTPADGEDLAQDITLALWRAFPAYDPARKFSTWMYRIALNVAISHLRRHKPALPLSATPEPSMAPSPQIEELYRLVAQLDPLDRSLVLLYLEGYSFPEIGDILGISATNASTKLTRIKHTWKDSI